MADDTTKAIYRAIWNSDYDTDLAANGRSAAHTLAEQITGALAKDGLLARPVSQGPDYSALADACDDYLYAYRGDGPDDRISAAAGLVRAAGRFTEARPHDGAAVSQAVQAVHLLVEFLGVEGTLVELAQQMVNRCADAERDAAEERARHRADVDREALLDVLRVADADYSDSYRTTAYLTHLADRLIAAGAIAGTP